jgi:ABC-type branched-subunit amino acid transport system substrate-binding protein
LGDTTRADAIYVGLLAPLTGSAFAKPIGKAITTAVDAAVRAYNQSIAGQPGDPRPLAVVVCDETGDIVAATDHLVDTVGVKGIVGPFDEARLDSIVEKTKAGNVVVMAPFSNRIDFKTNHAGSGLVWSCAPNRSGALLYLKSLLDLVVQTIKTKRDPEFVPVVALYTSEDLAAAQMGDQAIVSDPFPSKPQRTTYPYFLLAESQSDYRTLAQQAIDQEANLIVNFGSGLGDFDKIVDKMEIAWPRGVPRPYYVSYQRSTALATGVTENITGADAGAGSPKDVYQRTLVFDQPRSADVEKAGDVFSGRFRGIGSSNPQAQFDLAYDCVFVLALGLHAARAQSSIPPESVTGEQFRTGVGRLVGGEPWGIGVDQPSAIFTPLSSSNATMDIFGASGDLSFDIEAGYPDPGGALWCFEIDYTGHAHAVYKRTGVTFSSVDGKQQGEFSCDPAW